MNCLLVDDDPLICDLLTHYCSKVEEITTLTVTNSGFEAISLLNQQQYDLILLDYNLPDITGKDLLVLQNMSAAVIVITSHKDFASESYNYDQVVDFLVKPIDFSRFVKAVIKAARYLQSAHLSEEAPLFVKDGNKLVKVDLSEVLYIRSAANYVQVVLENKKIMTLMALKDMEAKLPGYFQRVHRSYIVNVNKIEMITSGDIHIGDEEIAVSDTYEKALLEKINLLN